MPYDYHNLTPSHSSFSTSNHHPRNTPPSRGMYQHTDLLSLVPPQETPPKKKAPSKRNHNHLGAPSTAGSHPGGKRMSGNENVSGDTDGDSDAGDASSTQEDEDADDENDDDEEEPAVDSPASVNRKRKYSYTDPHNQSGAVFKEPTTSENLIDDISALNGITESTVHPAGRISKQRTYSMASTNTVQSSVASEFDDGVITETDDDPDYPCKKVARGLSTSDMFVELQSNGSVSEEPDSETVIEDLNADADGLDMTEGNEDNGGDHNSLPVDETPVLSEEDDEEIEEVEAQELAREFEIEGPDFLVDVAGSPGVPLESDHSIYDGLLSDEDCVGEPGLPNGIDPLQWNDLSGLLYYDSLVNDNLFSVPASREESPRSPTPRPVRVKSPLMDPEVFHSDEWSDGDEDIPVDPDLDNPFFEMHDLAVRHMVNNANNQHWDPTWMASEDENVWKAFESGDSSGEESESNDAARESDQGTEVEEEDYDSDATDLDDDLPTPTPQKDSKLKRLPSPTPKPQILRRDPANKNGPLLGSWIADPDRPICIIDGTKKTILIPASTKRFSLGSDSSYPDPYTFDENDFDACAFSYGANNPTLSGSSGVAGDCMNGDAICGPTEAFDPSTDFLDFDDLLKTEYDDANEDSVDEEEQMLSIEDVLALSESEDDGDNEDQSDFNLTPIARKTSDIIAGDNADAEAMLTRWDSVSVTAFRKRQQQHKQRLSGTRNKGALKGKLTVSDTAMTPARRRKLKATNQKPIPMNSNRRNKKDDTQWSTTLPPLFEAI
ncbi:hypothetical protein EV426DRAFT_703310 [Tirmania nivea]|nr:hypothetical protein EV426DRAFT_703310 [Tirmania nivea]